MPLMPEGTLQRLQSAGLRRGLLDGNVLWLLLGGLISGVRVLRWATRREAELVFLEVLDPGETVTVDTARPRTRRQRKRERRADRKLEKRLRRRERRNR